ncbi:MAG: HDIG domain-containing protein [Gloeobacteraceae cyanobacterium ES-bin-144]|nr:HDIG domain-containing protein [Verrucomicrobiales bacterium]
MRGFFEKKKLVKKGLACGKTRRKQSKSEILHRLETDGWVKAMVLLLFTAGLAGLIFYGQQETPAKFFLISLLILCTAIAQLWINHPQTFASNSRLTLIFSVLLAHLGVCKLIMEIFYEVSKNNEQIIWQLVPILLIPYAFAPLVISVLLGRNHAIFTAIFVSLWSSILFRGIDPSILVLSLISGFISVFVTLQVRRRSRLIRAGVYVGLATWLLAMSFGLISFPFEDLGATDWQLVGWQSAAAIGSGIITAMLVSGALPMLESLFGITTDISWLEIADLNHPLLRRLSAEAPGTYHHSLMVASLAEAAAEKIQANATLCRVCSYFHDIGKLVKPEYFTENINEDRNPHDDLAPSMSALIIISHVKEGVDLALKHKLNHQIIDIIQQHHGTSLVWYFFKRAQQQQEDARAGGKIMNMREEDIPEVREESFRYPGPKSQFKEAGIISLADSVESASRSLVKPTPQKIEQLVGDIIEKRISDGQLDDCDLTLREIKAIGESFRFSLQNMLHSRIAYPKDEPKTTARTASVNLPPATAA